MSGRARLRVVSQEPIHSVEDIPEQFILCRDLLHAWQPYDARISRKHREIERVMRCLRCATLKVQVFSLEGELKRSRYEYVEGYLLKGVGHLTVDDRARLRVLDVDSFK
jgi:hypothetical protein